MKDDYSFLVTRRKKTGDIYEVKTERGFAYFQYTHEYTKSPKWGSLIRVLDGFYEQKPTIKELKDLVNKQRRFQTFCFQQQGIKAEEVLFVENLLVPDFAQHFPIFKHSMSLSKKQKAPWSVFRILKSRHSAV